MTSPKVVRWGILATGGIAQTFTKDLLVDPSTRGVKNVKHEVVAVASASGVQRAKHFIKDVGVPESANAYGSYAEFVKDDSIDIVYIATPHSHHYQNARLCLDAGKNVLCEKAFTVNAAQAKELTKIAREKNLFLMEAVWTRYFPLSIYVRDVVTSGKLGTVQRVTADNSIAFSEDQKAGGTHRLVNPELAGGALLDLGIYSLTWIFQTLYTTLPPAERKPPKVQSSMNINEGTGAADELTTVLLEFPRSGGNVHAVATTGLTYKTDPKSDFSAGPACSIQASKGELQVFAPLFRPTKTRLILQDGTVEDKDWPQPGPGKGSGWYNGFGGGVNGEGEGHGMFWEADEAATALVEGRKEGRFEDLAESITIMEVMDQVRAQGGLKYPESIETLKYPQ